MTIIPIASEGDMELAIKETVNVVKYKGRALLDLTFYNHFMANVFLQNLNVALETKGLYKNGDDVELNIVILGEKDNEESE
tara:strand:+ start:117 stop:359 length:243 start_codon:yes stop_codon:yes gene_type:complete